MIYKAYPTDPTRLTPDLHIEATEPAANELLRYAGEGWMEECRKHYEEQASEILSRLLLSLPGGTIDALLVALLDHHRSLLRVTHTLKEPTS